MNLQLEILKALYNVQRLSVAMNKSLDTPEVRNELIHAHKLISKLEKEELDKSMAVPVYPNV